MSMPVVTITYAGLLILLGVGGYVLGGMESKTALIPAFFGLAFLVCGLLALKETLRKHVMHAAALLVVLAIGAVLARWLRAGFPSELTLASGSQIAMVLLSAGYLAMSVNSFIQARRRREAESS